MEIMFNIKSLCFIARDSLRPTVKTTSWLLKIMIPISLAVCLMQYYGIIAWCADLNIVLPDFPEPFSSLTVSADETSIGMVLRAWLISSVKLAAMIFAIIYALMFVQRLMERFELMQRLMKPLEPLMVFFGLPRNAAYLWLVGNVLGISYGSAVMLQLEEEGKINREEANEVNYHLIMNHSMLEDTLVFATAGVSALWILSTRLLFALLLV